MIARREDVRDAKATAMKRTGVQIIFYLYRNITPLESVVTQPRLHICSISAGLQQGWVGLPGNPKPREGCRAAAGLGRVAQVTQSSGKDAGMQQGWVGLHR